MIDELSDLCVYRCLDCGTDLYPNEDGYCDMCSSFIDWESAHDDMPDADIGPVEAQDWTLGGAEGLDPSGVPLVESEGSRGLLWAIRSYLWP